MRYNYFKIPKNRYIEKKVVLIDRLNEIIEIILVFYILYN